jgi:gluconolactonase
VSKRSSIHQEIFRHAKAALLLLVACSSSNAGPIRPARNDAADEPADAAAPLDAARMTTTDASVADAAARDTAAAEAAIAVEAGADSSPDAPPQGLGPAGGACPGGPYGSPLPAERTATQIHAFPGRTLEGPVWVPSQHALYFSDIGGTLSNGRIQKYTPADGKITVFADNVGIGGLALDPQGMLVAASHDKQRLTRFDPATAARTDVAGGAMYMGKPFNQVNDVVVRSDGNMYFSDPTYQLAGRQGQGVMAFYRLSPLGEVTRITTATNPNGVALSPDGLSLYLATTGGGPLQRFPLAADGSVAGAGTTLTSSNSDGMAVDCAGNLYLTSGGLKVYSSTGQPLGSIAGLTSGFTTNSAFGGEDRRTLFITNSTALYRIELGVPGFPN